jgi:hypothetical protein
MFAKFKNSKEIISAPRNKGAILNYDRNEEAMRKDGYKPVVFSNEKPIGEYEVEYSESSRQISARYVKKEYVPEPDTRIYAEKRATEYPGFGDFIDAVQKAEEGDPTELAKLFENRRAIKKKYPKEK